MSESDGAVQDMLEHGAYAMMSRILFFWTLYWVSRRVRSEREFDPSHTDGMAPYLSRRPFEDRPKSLCYTCGGDWDVELWPDAAVASQGESDPGLAHMYACMHARARVRSKISDISSSQTRN